MANKSATYRYIEKVGHDAVLTTYAEGGVDAWEDSTLIATDSTITAIRKLDWPNVSVNEGGASPTGTAMFCVKDTVTIFDGGTTQASVITDDGVQYKVISVDDQRLGMILVTAERNRQ